MSPVDDPTEANAASATAIVAMYRGEEGGLDGLADLLHPDVVTTDWMFPGEVMRGAEAFVQRVLVEAGAAFPDATEEVLRTTFDGTTLVVAARFRATFAGPFYGAEPHGGPLSWEIVDHWRLEGGQVVEVAFAADTAAAWRQLLNRPATAPGCG